MIQRPKTWSSQAIAACDAALELLGCEIQCISNQTLDLVSLCVFSVYSCSHHVFITLARWIFQVGSRQRQGALPKSWVQNQVRRVRFRVANVMHQVCLALGLSKLRPTIMTWPSRSWSEKSQTTGLFKLLQSMKDEKVNSTSLETLRFISILQFPLWITASEAVPGFGTSQSLGSFKPDRGTFACKALPNQEIKVVLNRKLDYAQIPFTSLRPCWICIMIANK